MRSLVAYIACELALCIAFGVFGWLFGMFALWMMVR
jgi:hypothetical protein